MFRLLRFPGDGDGTGEGAAGAGGGGGTGGGAAGAGATGGGDGDGGKGDALTLTPAQLASRLQRAERTALETAAQAAGFESVEAMQAAARAHRDAEDAARSELERAQAAATAAETRAAEAEARAQRAAIGAAFMAQASAANIPADRIEDALALADLSAVTVGTDGRVVGAAEAVAELVEAKPWLVGTVGGNGSGPKGTGADGGARGGGNTHTLAPDKAAMAANFGLDPNRVAEADAAKPNTPEHRAYLASRAEPAKT